MRIVSARHRRFDERGLERRRRNVSFYYPERRRGFDRRHPAAGTLRAWYRRILEQYRHDHDTIAAVLLVFVLLNIIDLLLTLQALSMGAVEVNPFMAFLFALDPVVASVFKVVVGAEIALAIWLARRYRRMLEASLVLVGMMTLVLVVHGYNALV